MISLNMFRAFLTLFVLGIWMIAGARECHKNEFLNNGQCCDLCPPGTYMESFCSATIKTICKPCSKDSYAETYNFFDTCKPCQSCQAYSQNCTKTTNGNCTCSPGFLCANSKCSVCEENKCTKGEKVIKKVTPPNSSGPEKYSYHCEPKCSEHEHFDPSDNKCKKKTQVSVSKPFEATQRTKTDDPKPDPKSYHWFIVIISTGFVLVSITFIAFVFHTWPKERRNPIANSAAVQVPPAKTIDFHLSKEESGLQLITQDESTDSNRFDSCNLKEVSILSL